MPFCKECGVLSINEIKIFDKKLSKNNKKYLVDKKILFIFAHRFTIKY